MCCDLNVLWSKLYGGPGVQNIFFYCKTKTIFLENENIFFIKQKHLFVAQKCKTLFLIQNKNKKPWPRSAKHEYFLWIQKHFLSIQKHFYQYKNIFYQYKNIFYQYKNIFFKKSTASKSASSCLCTMGDLIF